MLTELSISYRGIYNRTGVKPASPWQVAAREQRRDDFYIRSHKLSPVPPMAAKTVKTALTRVFPDKIILAGVPTLSTVTRITVESPVFTSTPFLADINAGLSWLFSYTTITFTECSYRFHGCEVNTNWPPIVGVEFDYIDVNARGVTFVKLGAYGAAHTLTHFRFLGVIEHKVSNTLRFYESNTTTVEVTQSRALVTAQPVYDQWGYVRKLIRELREWKPLRVHVFINDKWTPVKYTRGCTSDLKPLVMEPCDEQVWVAPCIQMVSKMIAAISRVRANPTTAGAAVKLYTLMQCTVSVFMRPTVDKAKYDALVAAPVRLDEQHRAAISKYEKFDIYLYEWPGMGMNNANVYLDGTCLRRPKSQVSFGAFRDAFKATGFAFGYQQGHSIARGGAWVTHMHCMLNGIILPGKSAPVGWDNNSVDRFLAFAREYLE